LLAARNEVLTSPSLVTAMVAELASGVSACGVSISKDKSIAVLYLQASRLAFTHDCGCVIEFVEKPQNGKSL